MKAQFQLEKLKCPSSGNFSSNSSLNCAKNLQSYMPPFNGKIKPLSFWPLGIWILIKCILRSLKMKCRSENLKCNFLRLNFYFLPILLPLGLGIFIKFVQRSLKIICRLENHKGTKGLSIKFSKVHLIFLIWNSRWCRWIELICRANLLGFFWKNWIR